MLYLYCSDAVLLQYFRRNCNGSDHICCDQPCGRKSKREEDERPDGWSAGGSVRRKVFPAIEKRQ